MDSIDIEKESVIEEEKSISAIWEYDSEADSMIKHQSPENVTIDMVMKELNSRYTNISLDLVKTSNDTVYVKIDDVSSLSAWGSAGNFAFLAEVVYSLTEVPSYNYVNLHFEEIDHASPGVYQRSDFNNKVAN